MLTRDSLCFGGKLTRYGLCRRRYTRQAYAGRWQNDR
jgi:hypothetical protein